MTDEELAAVLRWRGSALQEGAFPAAADRIEQLTAELAGADAMIEAQAKDHASNNIRFAEAEHRAKVAEAERDRLQQALTTAAGRLAWVADTSTDPFVKRLMLKEWADETRAELEGEGHE